MSCKQLDHGINVVVQMEAVLTYARRVIIGSQGEFMSNAKELAIASASLRAKVKNYIASVSSNNGVLLLCDLLDSCINSFESSVVETIQSTKEALQNPLSLESFCSSSECSDKLTKAIKDTVCIMQLIDSIDTDAQYLQTSHQRETLHILLQQAISVSTDMDKLLKIAENGMISSKNQQIIDFKSAIQQLNSTSDEFVNKFQERLPNRLSLCEDLQGNLEDIVLFSQHAIHNNQEGATALKQTRPEFINAIRNIAVSLYDDTLTGLSNSSDDSETLSPRKRHGMRVFASPQSGSNVRPKRTFDIHQFATEKITKTMNMLHNVKLLYSAIESLEIMKQEPWFANHYSKESPEKKMQCIRNIMEGLSLHYKKKPDTFIRKKPLRTTPIPPKARATIITGIDTNDFNSSRDMLKNITQMQSSMDLTSLKHVIPVRVPKSLNRSNKRLTLTNTTHLEITSLFQANIERLLASFTIHRFATIDLTELLNIGNQCGEGLENILLLCSMYKNEKASTPPPKFQQLLLQDIFNKMRTV